MREIPHYKAILALICFGGFCISILINYPGFMSPDSADQILEARNGVYADWHPPIMALLWHFVDQVISGPLGMLFVETALIWLGTFIVTLYWFLTDRPTLLSLLPAFIIFYPPVFGISGAIWKDIFMWAFLMLALGMAGTIDTEPPPPRYRNYAKCILAAGFLFIAILFRGNALFATVPIMALCIGRCFGPCLYFHRFIISIVFGALVCLALVFLSGPVNRSIAECRTNSWASLAIFDIAGTIYNTPQPESRQTLYEHIPTRIRGNGSLERLLELYNSKHWLPLFMSQRPALFLPTTSQPLCVNVIDASGFYLTEPEKASLIQLWKISITGHSLAWLSHRLSVFRHVIGFNHDYLWSPVFMEPNGFSGWHEAEIGRNPELNKFQTSVKWVLVYMSNTWFFRPWIYLLLDAAIIVLCLVRYNAQRAQIGLIAASGLTHETGLFLLAPSPDSRYSHYMIYASLVALLLIMRTFSKQASPPILRADFP